jgi:hypothetical protein
MFSETAVSPNNANSSGGNFLHFVTVEEDYDDDITVVVNYPTSVSRMGTAHFIDKNSNFPNDQQVEAVTVATTTKDFLEDDSLLSFRNLFVEIPFCPAPTPRTVPGSLRKQESNLVTMIGSISPTRLPPAFELFHEETKNVWKLHRGVRVVIRKYDSLNCLEILASDPSERYIESINPPIYVDYLNLYEKIAVFLDNNHSERGRGGERDWGRSQSTQTPQGVICYESQSK